MGLTPWLKAQVLPRPSSPPVTPPHLTSSAAASPLTLSRSAGTPSWLGRIRTTTPALTQVSRMCFSACVGRGSRWLSSRPATAPQVTASASPQPPAGGRSWLGHRETTTTALSQVPRMCFSDAFVEPETCRDTIWTPRRLQTAWPKSIGPNTSSCICSPTREVPSASQAGRGALFSCQRASDRHYVPARDRASWGLLAWRGRRAWRPEAPPRAGR